MSLEEEGIIEKYNNIIIYTEPRLSTILFLYVKEPTSHVLFIVQTFCYNLLEIRLRKVHNERENMAIYFIDGDNNPKENIKEIELLAAGDEVHIFYAAKNTYYSSDKNRKAIMAMTEAGVFYKKVMSAPNSVDFAISIAAAERMGSRDGKNIFLVSSDKHFDTIVSLLKEKIEDDILVKRIETIWKGAVMEPSVIETWDKVCQLMKNILGKEGELLYKQIKSLPPDVSKERTLLQRLLGRMRMKEAS